MKALLVVCLVLIVTPQMSQAQKKASPGASAYIRAKKMYTQLVDEMNSHIPKGKKLGPSGYFTALESDFDSEQEWTEVKYIDKEADINISVLVKNFVPGHEQSMYVLLDWKGGPEHLDLEYYSTGRVYHFPLVVKDGKFVLLLEKYNGKGTPGKPIWRTARSGEEGVNARIIDVAPTTGVVQPKEPPAVYTYVEQMPVPSVDVNEYFSKNLHYPPEADSNNVQGRVIVQFVVNEDGSLSDVKVVRGIGSGCDEEAVRAIKGMPAFKPGKQNGKAVRVMYTIPLTFRKG